MLQTHLLQVSAGTKTLYTGVNHTLIQFKTERTLAVKSIDARSFKPARKAGHVAATIYASLDFQYVYC